MAKSPLATLAGPQLFRHCAAHTDDDECWAEFVRRYNPLLVRSITAAWRRCGQGSWPPHDVAEDLLNDVYLAIVKHDFRLLQNFHGSTEEEANAYLAETAINRTRTFLRARSALSRTADEISLNELIEATGEEGRLPESLANRPQSLTEMELVESMERCFDGPNRNRDVFIFLLHVRNGYTTTEISTMGFCDLKVSSINNLIVDMKKKLRKCFTSEV